MGDGRTYALPHCEPACPPLEKQPARALIAGSCNLCSHPLDAVKSARELAARAAIKERGL